MKFSVFIIFHLFFLQINGLSPLFEKTLGHLTTKTSTDIQQNAVENLIGRLLPNYLDKFQIKIDPNLDPDGNDQFRLTKNDLDQIEIEGTTGVAAATGLNYYLKYYCNAHISWEANQLNLPETLPDVNLTQKIFDKFRYYQNTCTVGYSFIWWNWNDWEKHIDWIVLNSFNLVLAFHGQEAIWARVYEKFGLNDTEIREYFTGPAFLPWLRMGNIGKWGGPLSDSWHTRTLSLQKQYLERLRSFGVLPILPAFAGFVPKTFKTLYPNDSMSEMAGWNKFNSTYHAGYFVEPTVQLFNDVGKAFMEEQINEFGTNHLYNCDSFNENTPANSDLDYLANVGKSIYKAMTDVDPDAIWIMQGWLFLSEEAYWTKERAKALLTSVPIGKMIVLDLQSEEVPQFNRLDQYFGQPYIWCMLHNFGGTLGMFGSSEIINEEPYKARINGTMIGTGLTPEGINTNYVIYELMIETSLRNESTDLGEWFKNYSIRRYGQENTNAIKAWQLLQKSVYNYKELTRLKGHYAITLTPSLNIDVWYWYELSDLLKSWQFLLDAGDDLYNSTAYKHDLVDITRQVLQHFADIYYLELIKSYRSRDNQSFNDKAEIFLMIFDDLEWILATNKAFLLGEWLESAKQAANDSADRELFEYNARNQITLWGPNGEIMNYAIKQWSGVVSTFLGPRWALFVDYLNETLVDGLIFDQDYIKKKMFEEVEEVFTFNRDQFPVEPLGDTIEIAHQIHAKWTIQFLSDQPSLVLL